MENLNRFYDWMVSIGNIYLADNERMTRAYEVVFKEQEKVIKKVARKRKRSYL